MIAPARTSGEDLPPPSIGNLAQHAPAKILGSLGRMRFTGELRFTLGQKTHSVDVRGGVTASDADATRAMELFLSAASGPYELREQVPLLPGAVRQDALAVGGSLADAGPADLLNFCESIGLTGKLEIESEGRACVARYSRGELASLAVDGQDDGAIDALFACREGRYKIRQRDAFEDEAPSSMTELQPALGTIEMALSEILARSAKGKPAAARPVTRPPSIAPPPMSPDQSVKIIFRAPKLERDSKTAHASAHVGSEVVSLDAGTSTGPLDDARAEEIVRKARESAALREEQARDAERASAAAAAPPTPVVEPAVVEPPSTTKPASSGVTVAFAMTLLAALVLGLWSLASMMGPAR
jgi:hypothetical protein